MSKKGFLNVLLKALFCGFIIAAISLTTKFKANASTFDPQYYAARYPDVAQALGTSSIALYNHYINNGMNEGRYANAEDEANGIKGAPIDNVSPTFATYVDVNITSQTMTYYQDSQAVLQSPIVTGNESEGRNTPTGVYEITNKVNGKYLTGPTWHSWVDYWMPFNKSIGLHDATWRSEFGGTIYQNGGSHGCVNLPHDIASQLYAMVETGTVVVVH
ncbi:MAG: L,D-transpeptidase [Butyrivibrio sp.]|nr:L,D-transpeptidase [Butyrivibrio sp.]